MAYRSFGVILADIIQATKGTANSSGASDHHKKRFCVRRCPLHPALSPKAGSPPILLRIVFRKLRTESEVFGSHTSAKSYSGGSTPPSFLHAMAASSRSSSRSMRRRASSVILPSRNSR